jgi:nucleoside-diphosphate-sugar epimerase
MLNLVTGGAGFLGSNLVNALVDDGDRAIIIDNLSTGQVRNLEHALSSGRTTFVYADVAVPFPQLAEIVAKATSAKIDRIYHLASPASLAAYSADPWGTLAVNGLATMSLVELAQQHDARFLFASAAEIYGDPATHPQSEEYVGAVDPIGPRSAYDGGKRFGEAVVAAAVRNRGLDGRIARIFDCYGPGMAEADGRLVPSLIEALLNGKPLPIHGTGKQTRSLAYVADAVALVRVVMEAAPLGFAPVNVGSDDERSVEDIARTLASVVGTPYEAVHLAPREGDPQRRRPELTRARGLGWSPATPLESGLRTTYEWFAARAGVRIPERGWATAPTP